MIYSLFWILYTFIDWSRINFRLVSCTAPPILYLTRSYYGSINNIIFYEEEMNCLVPHMAHHSLLLYKRCGPDDNEIINKFVMFGMLKINL